MAASPRARNAARSTARSTSMPPAGASRATTSSGRAGLMLTISAVSASTAALIADVDRQRQQQQQRGHGQQYPPARGRSVGHGVPLGRLRSHASVPAEEDAGG